MSDDTMSETDHMMFTILSNPDRVNAEQVQACGRRRDLEVGSSQYEEPRITELPPVDEMHEHNHTIQPAHPELETGRGGDPHSAAPLITDRMAASELMYGTGRVSMQQHAQAEPALISPTAVRTDHGDIHRIDAHDSHAARQHESGEAWALSAMGVGGVDRPGESNSAPALNVPVSLPTPRLDGADRSGFGGVDPAPDPTRNGADAFEHDRNNGHAGDLRRDSTDVESDEATKRSLLHDLRQLQMQGAKLTKEWTMNDRAADMTLEIRRITLAMDETANIGMMRDGMKMLVTGIEMINNRIGFLDLQGWSSEVCRDMSKHDPNLARIYRRYWRRSTQNSPEVDICLSLIGSAGMFHMKRKMSQSVMNGRSGQSSGVRAQNPFGKFQKFRRGPDQAETYVNSSDEEGPP